LDDGGTAGQAAGALEMLGGYTKKLFEIPKNFKNFFKKNWNLEQKKRIPPQQKILHTVQQEAS
jgi:DNA-binding transcriptional regulator GbsR (MarR family)